MFFPICWHCKHYHLRITVSVVWRHQPKSNIMLAKESSLLNSPGFSTCSGNSTFVVMVPMHCVTSFKTENCVGIPTKLAIHECYIIHISRMTQRDTGYHLQIKQIHINCSNKVYKQWYDGVTVRQIHKILISRHHDYNSRLIQLLEIF